MNCGLRISELVGLNVTDVRGDQLRVLGKGNKERVLFLNEACQQALQDWLTERNMLTLIDKEALFITHQNRRRISRAAVHKLVKSIWPLPGWTAPSIPPISCATLPLL